MNENPKSQIADQQWIFEAYVSPLANLTLSGWILVGIDPALVEIKVICNGVDMNRNLVRHTVSEFAEPGQTLRARLSFKLVLPGYVWERAGPNGCVLEIHINGKKLDWDGNVFTRDQLVAFLGDLVRAEEPLSQRLQVALLEHVRYAGVLAELDPKGLAYVNDSARELGLESFLYPNQLDRRPSTNTLDGSRVTDPQEARLHAMLAAFNQSLRDPAQDPYLTVILVLRDKSSENLRAHFVESLVPYFCEIGLFDLLSKHVDHRLFASHSKTTDGWKISATLPYFVFSGDYERAIRACNLLAARSDKNIGHTQCINYSVRSILYRYRQGRVDTQTLSRYISAVIGLLNSEGQGGYWSRLHDLNLVESSVELLSNFSALDSLTQQSLIDAVLRNYSLCPTLWQLLQDAGVATEAIDDALVDAERKSSAFFSLVSGDEIDQTHAVMLACRLLLHFDSIGNIDAIAYLRELCLHGLPRVLNQGEFQEYGEYLERIFAANPSEVVRFAAAPWIDPYMCRFDSSVVKYAVQTLKSRTREPSGAVPHSDPLFASNGIDPCSDTLVVIYSCRQNLKTRVAAIRGTWLNALKSRGIPYLILIGGSDERMEGDVLTLAVPDCYEDLPAKTLALMRWFLEKTEYEYLYKIDDDCLLNVDAFFSEPIYRRHHYYGRILRRGNGWGRTPRDWHQSMSVSESAKKSLDKSPDPSQFLAGGSGYVLSRRAIAALVEQTATPLGSELVVDSFFEDKLVGDLLSLCQIYPANESYDISMRRRLVAEGIPVGIFSNTFMPGLSSSTKLVHLDGYEAMETVWARCASEELWPKMVWPTLGAPALGGQSNQMELISPRSKLSLLESSGIIVVCMLRNERTVLPHFLSHYRSIGVSAFILIDNLSSDGSREYLVSQPDVVLYTVETSFKNGHCGVAWQQAALSNHCIGKWVIVVDADEFLVYRDCEKRDIAAFVAEIEESGSNAVQTSQVDMYPDRPLDQVDFARQSPFDAACYFDSPPLIDWSLYQGRYSNSSSRTSALRHRMAPGSKPHFFTSHKVALFRYFPWLRLYDGMHFVANVSVATQQAFLCHFKYHAGFKTRVIEEVQRQQHFNQAVEYKIYWNMLADSRGVFWSEATSAKYETSDSLYSRVSPSRELGESVSAERATVRRPFIIWTVQRTGGSNLAYGLSEITSPEECLHEPFNLGRPYGHITERWKQQGDLDQLKADIREICRAGPSFKHCVEVVPDVINTVLEEVSREFEYIHLFLYRRNSLARLLSLHFARTTGIWGPEIEKNPDAIGHALEQSLPVQALVAHERQCVLRLGRIWTRLRPQANLLVAEVAFEDLYEAASKVKAKETLESACRFLELQLNPRHRQTIDKIVTEGQQETRDLYSRLSGLEGLTSELQASPSFNPKLARDLLDSLELFSYPSRVSALAEVVMLEVASVSHDGEELAIGGLLLFRAQSEQYTLALRLAGSLIPVEIGLSSPWLSEHYPANPNAATARFRTLDFSLAHEQGGALVLIDGGGVELVIGEVFRT